MRCASANHLPIVLTAHAHPSILTLAIAILRVIVGAYLPWKAIGMARRCRKSESDQQCAMQAGCEYDHAKMRCQPAKDMSLGWQTYMHDLQEQCGAFKDERTCKRRSNKMCYWKSSKDVCRARVLHAFRLAGDQEKLQKVYNKAKTEGVGFEGMSRNQQQYANVPAPGSVPAGYPYERVPVNEREAYEREAFMPLV